MINKFRIGAASAVLALAAGMGSVAQAAEADGTATVEVLRPITLTAGDDLDFGLVAVNGSGSISVGFDPIDGSADLDCSAADIVCVGGGESLASFSITGGSANRSVSITLPSADIDMVSTTAVNPAAPTAAEVVVLSGLESDAVINEFDPVTGTLISSTSDALNLDASGEGSFSVGGTATFDGSEGPGVYEATFTVTVEYS